jgi:hypothetical protein
MAQTPSAAPSIPLPPRIFSALYRQTLSCAITPLSARRGLAQLASDYVRCVNLGGNLEREIFREEGVSFNPRLARVLSILINDGSIRDWGVLQRALYGATVLNLSLELRAATLDGELKDLTGQVRCLLQEVLMLDSSDNGEALTLLGVVLLDDIRHLHRTDLSADKRSSRLKRYHDLSLSLVNRVPEWLERKLLHAMRLQGACENEEQQQ